MSKLFLVLVLLVLLMTGVHSDDDPNKSDVRASARCKNPNGKIGQMKIKGCSSNVCKKNNGGGASWKECPRPATSENVNKEMTSLRSLLTGILTNLGNTFDVSVNNELKVITELLQGPLLKPIVTLLTEILENLGNPFNGSVNNELKVITNLLIGSVSDEFKKITKLLQEVIRILGPPTTSTVPSTSKSTTATLGQLVNPVVLLTGGHIPNNSKSDVSVEVYSPLGTCNKELEDLPYKYRDHSANLYIGEIIICGGQQQSTRCLFMDQNQRFVEHSRLPQPMGHDHDGAVVGDTLSLIGGRYSAIVETWNGSQWETKSFPEIEDQQIDSCIDAISKDTLLMVGGRRVGGDWKSSNKLMKYYKKDKDQDGVWERLEDYPGTAGHSFGCAFINTPEGDSFLIAGGGSASSYLYNIQENTWEEVGRLSIGRRGGKIVVVDGKVLMLGQSWGPKTVEEYDVESKTWSPIEQEIKYARGQFDAVVVPGALVGC